MPREWVISPPWPGRRSVSERLDVAPAVAQVLFNRGLADADAIARFLEPRMTDLYPPESVAGVVPAAERLVDAARAARRIVLYGDYDVDGVTGVAILWHALRMIGANAEWYVPHRIEEGYGLSPAAIGTLADEGADVIVSVDCGVTAIESAALARRRGVELIITDHHAPHRDADGRTILPPETLIVHPNLPEAGPGPVEPCNRDLSGAGVAFKLAWAIAQRASGSAKVRPDFRDFLVNAMSLAALGTIADVVPLLGENRVISFHGLRGLPAARLPGLVALMEAAELTGARLTGYDIGFKLAPRLNAVGRMGHARLAVQLLTRADDTEARQIAHHLEDLNRKRRTVDRRIAAEAREMAHRSGQDAPECRAIVLAADGWHAGVIGIAAARLVDEFHKPVVLIALDGEAGQGSARSVPGFALNEALAACGEHLSGHGGHAMAAGLRIEASRVPAFRDAFHAYATARLNRAAMTPRLMIDAEVELAALDEKLVDDFARLEPFGSGNPEPCLSTDWVSVVGEPRVVGANGEHLQFVLVQNGLQRRAIAFGHAKYRAPLCDARRCRVAFAPIINEFGGRRAVEIQVRDLQFPAA